VGGGGGGGGERRIRYVQREIAEAALATRPLLARARVLRPRARCAKQSGMKVRGGRGWNNAEPADAAGIKLRRDRDGSSGILQTARITMPRRSLFSIHSV
jgi:hypothetical protein